MKRIYLEFVVNEFFAHYGDYMINGELFIAELTHAHFTLNHELYLIIGTGVLRFQIHQNQFKIQTQLGFIEALLPTQILSLATSPRLTPKSAQQLRNFAFRIENRLGELSKNGLEALSTELEQISMGVRSVTEIQYYVSSFWHAIFPPENEGYLA